MANYRIGLGAAGNVGANSLTTLIDRPLGVSGVTNPEPGIGGQDAETVADIRSNAPLTVLTLGRAVSLADYESYASTFALITTDPEAAGQFCKEHNAVIYKSISGVRSIVTRANQQHLAKLDDVIFCPTQFQEYIPGIEYRVHVVGDEIFACAIRSEADDYRYASGSVEISACSIPDDIADRCRNLATSMKLTLAGIDLRCTPEGGWYCFEVNPSPGFNTYEECTGQPIAEAVARLLSSGQNMSSGNSEDRPSRHPIIKP